MNARKKKIILMFVLFLMLLMVLIVSFSLNNSTNRNNDEETGDTFLTDRDKNYEYNFDETLNLETDVGSEEIASNGTDYPSFGVLSEYYDNVDIRYDGDKMYVQSYDGYDVISLSWLNESFAQHINEPTFGILQKCVLKKTQFSAIYIEVGMKDVESYIEELTQLGFTEIVIDKKDKKQGYYIYSAKKGDITVTLNYTNNSDFTIAVF